jgi:hypothetical protein
MNYFGIRVRDDGLHEVYVTEDGISKMPLPRAVFVRPRDAVRFADMRQAGVSPLRPGPEGLVLSPPAQDEATQPASAARRHSPPVGKPSSETGGHIFEGMDSYTESELRAMDGNR